MARSPRIGTDRIVDDTTWGHLVLEITEIQYVLIAKGYDTGGHDGKAGPKTYEAILQFQRDNGLTADGMVGDLTWSKLMAADDGIGGTNGLPLKAGARGSKVICAQYALRILCCSPGKIDGTFGNRTYIAVKKFQSSNGLASDGIIGEATWEKLCAEIQNIQQALKNKGYAILVDGLAGLDTYEAVMQFQADNGLSKDGQVGAATREKLFGTAGGGVDGLPLKEGQSGDMITFLQRALRIAVINCPITGTFDAETKSCVIRYQGRNGLTADGIVGVKTWEKLRENVRRYQTALQNKGYDVGGIDGIAGDKTYNAILKFQSDNGLDADGMCGTQTQTKLFGASQGGGTTSSTLKLGSNGSLTRYLQIMLNTMGYSLSVDGIFGPNMEAAVKDYQSKNGLDADGICGGGTWSKLFSQYRVNVSGTGVQKFVNVAKHEVKIGFHEDNGNNINPYGQWYGINGKEWCAMFVSFCADQAGIMDTIVPRYSYTPTGASWYRNRGKYHKRSSGYMPKTGDTIYFYRPEKGRIGHTGIVSYAANGLVYTIEGNASDGVLEKSYSLSDSSIDGYGENGGTMQIVPDYTDETPKHIRDIIPFIEDLEDISNSMGTNSLHTSLNVLDYMRQFEYGEGFQWDFAVRFLNDHFVDQVNKELEAKKRSWLDPYMGIGQAKKNLEASGGRYIDVPHFCVTTEAYLIPLVTIPGVIPPYWVGWGGDLASAAFDLQETLPEEYQKKADEIVCKSGHFNAADMTSDADAIIVSQLIRNQINQNSKHPVSVAMKVYYETDSYALRHLHLIQDAGGQLDDSLEQLESRVQLEMLNIQPLWSLLGNNANEQMQRALIKAYAKFLYARE